MVQYRVARRDERGKKRDEEADDAPQTQTPKIRLRVLVETMLKDYRESFADDLRDPEFQQEYLTAAYEEEGVSGVIRALDEIARAGSVMVLPSGGDPSFKTLQSALQTLNLDFAIVRAPTPKM